MKKTPKPTAPYVCDTCRRDGQATLDEALLDDAERERLAAESQARRDALHAAPQRKVRGDGSEYDRYPDGRVVEVAS